MEERCEVLKRLGARFYGDESDYEGFRSLMPEGALDAPSDDDGQGGDDDGVERI